VSAVPLVAVVTPTWARHGFLLDRCIPSVQAQGHPRTEHIIVSDGPDPDLAERLSQPWLDGWKDLWFRELPGHDPEPHYGHLARAHALEWTAADYIAYCDDDDALRPDHVHRLAAALDENPDAGFAVSRMLSHGPHGESVIGHGPLACGNVGTPMIMHRHELARTVASWDHTGQYEDWDLVLAWINAGIGYVRVDAETVDVWPSAYR
jgi:glycosyltransferase involved in cell wall biosynthesis